MVSIGLAHARLALQVSAELLRHRTFAAPSIAFKALLARGLWDIELARFLMLGLHQQRMSAWPDTMNYVLDLEPGLRAINWQGEGRRLTVDKLITAERLQAADIPAAPLLATIGRDSQAHPHAGIFPVANTVADVVAILAGAPDLLFVKPATGWRGDGVSGPERDGAGWRIDGHALSTPALARHLLDRAPAAGLLLQRRVRSHRDLVPIGGQLGLGTVRINTALTHTGPEVLFAFAKVMGARGLVDNFSGGKFGNLLAAVDERTGRLTEIYGRRKDQRYLMERIARHPVTGTALVGFQLPLWAATIALAKRVAAAFPEAPLIGADIAVTDAGPLIIEVQSDWDANAAQLIMGKGLRPVMRELLPRLAVSPEVRELTMQRMQLRGARIKQAAPARHARSA